MRWQAYLGELRPSEASKLSTRFTAGCGWLALAGRLFSNDGAVTDIVAAVLRAADALRQVRARLVVPVDVDVIWPAPMPEPVTPRALQWRDLLLRCDFELAGKLIADLSDAIDEARSAGALAVADGDVAAIDAHLARALAILGRAALQLERVLTDVER